MTAHKPIIVAYMLMTFLALLLTLLPIAFPLLLPLLTVKKASSDPAVVSDGPIVFIGPFYSCSKPNNTDHLKCKNPNLRLFDFSVLPVQVPSGLITHPPLSPQYPLVVGVGLFFAYFCVALWNSVIVWKNLGTNRFNNWHARTLPRLQTSVGLVALFLSATFSLYMRMWLCKGAADFNLVISAMVKSSNEWNIRFKAQCGSGFTTSFVGVGFLAVSLLVPLVQEVETLKQHILTDEEKKQLTKIHDKACKKFVRKWADYTKRILNFQGAKRYIDLAGTKPTSDDTDAQHLHSLFKTLVKELRKDIKALGIEESTARAFLEGLGSEADIDAGTFDRDRWFRLNGGQQNDKVEVI